MRSFVFYTKLLGNMYWGIARLNRRVQLLKETRALVSERPPRGASYVDKACAVCTRLME